MLIVNRNLTSAVCAAFFSTCALAQPRPTPAPSAPNFHRMKLARITDNRGFDRPMTALTVLIPADWQFQGSAQYAPSPGCHPNLVKLVFRAVSPDGRLAIEMLPSNAWQWADDPNSVRMLQASNQQMAQFGARGCDVQPPSAAADFLCRSIIPAIRRDARVLAVEPVPDALAPVLEQAREAEQTAARQGIQVRVRADVARARLSYNLNGQPIEEWLSATTASTAMPGPTFDMYSGRMGQTLYYNCAVDHVFSFRAPQGQLDAQEKLARIILASVRVDPQWQARISQVLANLQAQDTRGARDRSAIITRNGQQIAGIIAETSRNTNESRDRAMNKWSHYMRGVETYRNPNTGETVDLSNQYGHAWAGANNEYIVSDSANFDPNVALRGNWTRLEPVRR